MTPEDFPVIELPPRNGFQRVKVEWPQNLRGTRHAGKCLIPGAKWGAGGVRFSIFTGESLAEARLKASEAIDDVLFAHFSAERGIRKRVRGYQRHKLKHAS